MAYSIWVFAEEQQGRVVRGALEVLHACRKLGDGGEDITVTAICLGSPSEETRQSLAKSGAQSLHCIENGALGSIDPKMSAEMLAKALGKNPPDAFFASDTTLSRDVFSRLAQRFDYGLATDCIDFHFDNGEMQFRRPVYGGRAFEVVRCIGAVSMATFRANSFPLNDSSDVPDQTLSEEVLSVDVNLEERKSRIVDVAAMAADMVRIDDAEIIVSGGRGMKSAENFALLEDLAHVLHAAVGASRVAVDSGWRDQSDQVGQTGKTVSPRLYIAVGISGAIQHRAGMSSSKTIVAINNDPEANIFQIADYGIVGDLFEVVPALTDACKELLA